MNARALGRFLFTALLSFPASAVAQEATIGGGVTDGTGAVLPGVTITAVHAATGNTFVGVTDERGVYRLPVRIGVFTIRAELPGFSTVNRPDVEVLVGQQLALNFQMALSTVEESVTVTGEAALVDTTQSKIGSNIDSRQMESIPINGRNWMELTLLAKGARGNAVTEVPAGATGGNEHQFQLNVDGQQVTFMISAGWGQPRFSRDAIAEFEYISSRFDATQGRSSGLQVNAVTKSGTNTYMGTLSGYFRDDRFRAADHVVGRVLPFSNQQVSGTFGGPIRKDRMHFFANYEYEREPQTFAYTSPFPRFNAVDLSATRTEKIVGGRFDMQINTNRRLTVRGSGWEHLLPLDPRNAGGATNHPSVANYINRWSGQAFATLTQTIGSRAVNEIKGGWNRFYSDSDGNGTLKGTPQINLRGYNLGVQVHYPLVLDQPGYSIRNDFATIAGDHQLKVGGEFLYTLMRLNWLFSGNGRLDATGGPVPANLQDLFPVWDDPSTWNLAALSPITLSWTQRIGDPIFNDPRKTGALWLQDDWRATERLTLNLGLRWDVAVGQLAETIAVPPFKEARSSEWLNLGPRLGFAYSATPTTVIRGGFGKYFAEVGNSPTHFTRSHVIQSSVQVFNDGRPDFAANPFNGPVPTREQIVRGEYRAVLGGGTAITATDMGSPYSYQTSIGVQRQLGQSMGLEADYVSRLSRRQNNTRQVNLSYNPSTQANYPFSDVAHRPFPAYGTQRMTFSEAWSNFHALEMTFNKRFSAGWQLTGNYTLGALWTGEPALLVTDGPLAPDLAEAYSLGSGDQRHRAVVNGIWDLPYSFQVSGLYFYGSGERQGVSCGCGDVRGFGEGTTRLRLDGTVIPKDPFVGDPIHRVDVRTQRRFTLGASARVDAIVEVFNVFNRANFGSYVTNESNARFRQPTQNVNIAYAPRTVQFGFRVGF